MVIIYNYYERTIIIIARELTMLLLEKIKDLINKVTVFLIKRWRAVKIVAIVLASVLAVVTVAVVAADLYEERRATSVASKMQEELVKSGLTVEKLEIERELASLEESSEDRLATVTILIREVDRQAYNSVRPVTQIFGFKAVMCLSPTKMPGDSGMMTTSAFKELMVNEGYSTAIHYDGSLPLSEYLGRVKERCTALKIDMPDTVYYAGGDERDPLWAVPYDDNDLPVLTELDPALKEYGVKYVIQETYQTKTVAYENFYTDFVYAEALGYNAVHTRGGYALAAPSIYNAMKRGAAVVLSLTFDKEHGYGGYYGELDEGGTLTDDFARMLKALDGFSSDVMVTDMKGVDEYRTEYQKSVPDGESIEARRIELLARLERINLEIDEIKKKYE